MNTRILWWGVVAVAAALRLANLGPWGYVDPYFAAGVRTMTGGGSNFWYGAFDAGGFLTVDKPPFAFWLQTLCCWLFGFSSFALCLPQALAGVGSVWLLGRLVATRAGERAGLLSALFLALTPICVAADKTNLVDSVLACVLLGAAWALFRALETGQLRWLLLSAALVAVGVHVKAGAAFAVVPALGLAYLLHGPVSWKTRIQQLAITLPVLLALSCIWMAVVDYTPPEKRPFIGSSKDNTARYQIFVHYGTRRLIGPPPSPPEPPKTGLYNRPNGTAPAVSARACRSAFLVAAVVASGFAGSLAGLPSLGCHRLGRLGACLRIQFLVCARRLSSVLPSSASDCYCCTQRSGYGFPRHLSGTRADCTLATLASQRLP
ncbi:MAG: glycosyltransferase family 39 protein [Armatimonas sp.]